MEFNVHSKFAVICIPNALAGILLREEMWGLIKGALIDMRIT